MRRSTSFSLALMLLGAACSRDRPAENSLGEAKTGDIAQKVTVSGFVAPLRKSFVAAPYAGYVSKLHVKVGDRVKAGDPLVVVAPILKTLGETLYPIRSPLSGLVAQVLKLEGEAVAADAATATGAVMRIDDTSRLFVNANIPELDLPKLSEGQEGIIRASAVPDRTYKGVIRSIFRSARDNENSWGAARVEFPVKIEVLDKDEALRPGMSVMLDIIARKKTNVVTLRLEYIQKTPEGSFVTLAGGERRKVELGLSNEDSVEITSGLKAGERVQIVNFAELPSRGT